MKFKFTLALFTLNIFFCKANDTLTRAQVYNFNVGDTFDYYWDSYPTDPPAGQGNPFTFQQGYQRVIITGVSYSGNNDTLFVNEQIAYPAPTETSTLSFTNLNNYEIYLDAVEPGCSPTYFFDTASIYNGKLLNAFFSPCFELFFIDSFAEGLGEVASHGLNGDYGSQVFHYDNSLIYYSKHGEQWGTPYTVTGVNNISQQIFISVYPTVNSGDFQVVTEDDADKMQLTVYDVYGRGVKVEDIYGGKNQIHMPGIASGVYLWNVTNPSGLIRSGKIIIE